MIDVKTPGLDVLVRCADAVLGEYRPDDAVEPAGALPDSAVAQLVEVLHEVLGDPALLPDGIGSGTPRYGFGKYLLHASPAYILFSTVTAPAFVPPIHDHGSWGLVGLYRGTEEEVRFELNPGAAGISEVGRAGYTSGDVMVIDAPPRDIHQVFNRDSRNSVAIHLFVHDLMTTGFQLYDAPDFVAQHTGPLVYDPVPPERARRAR